MTMFNVYSSDNDLIKTLKAHPISPSTTKWVMCYKIVIDFLRKNKMYSTIKAIDQELFEYDVTSKQILAHNPKKYKKLMPEGSSQYLESLCKEFDVCNSTNDSINVDSLVDSKPTILPDRNYYPLYDPKTG
ncbi:hypothetical protein TVAG_233150 [Trichomonas vaginalis G3]|uniref:Uncharacterized protein n=1 Tax=Trichomonas vaginalis (strain ATCC PRA-98 / G3) TaxID=412133 RepID=A2ERY4_TRIV3|nr:hypothetical protein TVAGG3_0486600 [Trichomonas vaginalis G3]EAY04579.1 hypothetical protein TVAG_233150 [Trichomonas vaginalis G3]KAI5516078.1 hypothetical protein TVAGG3_0486600 [Trichomonas vaginalis G3]|eukprot:XP_001316802.1 hypothetical protein [Trichomonas vaginalis G3]